METFASCSFADADAVAVLGTRIYVPVSQIVCVVRWSFSFVQVVAAVVACC